MLAISAQPNASHRSVRSCVGCRASEDRAGDLVRVAFAPGHGWAVDLAGRPSLGRGAYVHPTRACVAKGVKGGFAKAWKREVNVELPAFFEALGQAASARLEGLLLGARRAGHLAIGADAAREAVAEGAPLVFVAADAGHIVRESPFDDAIAKGHAVALWSKSKFGSLLGREEIAVVAVTHGGLADELRRTVSVLFASRSEACRSPEVQ